MGNGVGPILLVSNSVWNIIHFRGAIVSGLQERGYQLIVVAPPDEHVTSLAAMGVGFLSAQVQRKGKNPISDLMLMFRLLRVYRATGAGLILHYTIKPVLYGSVAAYIAGIPTISTITGLGAAFMKGGWLERVVGLLYRLTLRYAHLVFFQNKSDRQLFLDRGWVKSERVRLVPGSGVDVRFYAPRPPACKVDERSFRFLMIARLLSDKGVYEFVEVARRLQTVLDLDVEIKFEILGPHDPNNPAAIPKKVVDQWVSEGVIKYKSAVEDVRPWIAQADCVVLPSYREGLPRSLLEAASMAKPLIATDVPGCRDVVDDGLNGFLCLERDSDALMVAIKKMVMLSEKERKIFGRRGREKMIQQFDERIVVDRYIGAIEDLLEKDIVHRGG